MSKSRHQRRMLSEIPGESDALDIIVFFTQLPDRFHGIVRGCIIYQKNIIGIL